MSDNICEFCTEYNVEVVCELKEKCPIEALKRKCERLEKKVHELELSQSYDEDWRSHEMGSC